MYFRPDLPLAADAGASLSGMSSQTTAPLCNVALSRSLSLNSCETLLLSSFANCRPLPDAFPINSLLVFSTSENEDMPFMPRILVHCCPIPGSWFKTPLDSPQRQANKERLSFKHCRATWPFRELLMLNSCAAVSSAEHWSVRDDISCRKVKS